MNINDERGVTIKQVDELPCGAVFESNGKFYIRTDILEGSYVSCVNVANGGIKYYGATSMVRPVEATITIKDYER